MHPPSIGAILLKERQVRLSGFTRHEWSSPQDD